MRANWGQVGIREFLDADIFSYLRTFVTFLVEHISSLKKPAVALWVLAGRQPLWGDGWALLVRRLTSCADFEIDHDGEGDGDRHQPTDDVGGGKDIAVHQRRTEPDRMSRPDESPGCERLR